MQQAIDLPNLIARGGTFNGEVDKFPPGVVEALARARHRRCGRARARISGLHGVIGRNGRLTAAPIPAARASFRVEPAP